MNRSTYFYGIELVGVWQRLRRVESAHLDLGIAGLIDAALLRTGNDPEIRMGVAHATNTELDESPASVPATGGRGSHSARNRSALLSSAMAWCALHAPSGAHTVP